MPLKDNELKSVLKDITMVSLSYDNHKIQTKEDLDNYLKLVGRIKKLTKTQVGTNLLVDEEMFKKGNFINLVDMLFKKGISRIFALCPKNIPCPDILKNKFQYLYLTNKHKHFYTDDLTKMIIEECKYKN